jgi:serine/threonine protein kinase
MGKNKKTNKKVAIKQIEKQYSIPYEKQSYFFWELSISKTIKNIEVPYFVKIYDIFETFSHIYIVMEYAEDDFQNYLKNNWPDIDTIYDFVKQIANAILTLNKFGIMHRDLKIDNIILSYDNNDINDETNYKLKPNLKLIDFGLSKIIGFYESTNESYGTLFYISPEIVNNDYYNYKEDIWTFGIICYYFLTHNFPFFDNEYINFTRSEKILNVVKNLEEKNICLNENNYHDLKGKIIAKIVNLCLIKDINKRASINEIINLLI